MTSSAAHPPDAQTRPQEVAHLCALAGELDLQLAPGQAQALLRFTDLLLRWNRVHNLTAIRSGEDILTHHLLDSLSPIRPIERALASAGLSPSPHILDVGSGGGLPGIPIAIARPAWHLTLLDSVEKKTAFLRQAAGELALANVDVLHEHLAPAKDRAPRRYEAITSRAFASLADFVTLTHARLAPHGLWFAMKGRRPDDELAALPPGVEIADIVTLRVPRLAEARHLVVMRALPQA